MGDQRRSRRRFIQGIGGGLAAGLTGCFGGTSPPERARARRTDLERFADIGEALSAGYRTTATYIRDPDGIVGTQFVNYRIDGLDPTNPTILLYDVTANGEYDLVGVEWHTKAEGERPSLFGKQFYRLDDGPLPERYGLRAWLFRENPDGLFARQNPAIEPPEWIAPFSQTRRKIGRRFASAGAALEAGYENTGECVRTDRGGYGIPFHKPDAVRGTPAIPPILLYEVSCIGGRLLGAEWYVPANDDADTETTGLFDQRFHEPTDGHAPEQPHHQGLHGWLFRANPNGLFAPFNPNAGC